MSFSRNDDSEGSAYAKVYNRQRRIRAPYSISNESVNPYAPARTLSQQGSLIGALGASSAYDIRMLPNPFSNPQGQQQNFYAYGADVGGWWIPNFEETINKRLISTESHADIAKLPNPFDYQESADDYFKQPRTSSSEYSIRGGPPHNTRTLNKSAYGAESLADIRALPSIANLSPGIYIRPNIVPNYAPPQKTESDRCLNKYAASYDSQHELRQLPNYFAGPQHSAYEIVLRDFSAQSMEDLRRLPDVSAKPHVISDRETRTARLIPSDINLLGTTLVEPCVCRGTAVVGAGPGGCQQRYRH